MITFGLLLQIHKYILHSVTKRFVNYLSRWLFPLFKIVRKRQLQESDLYTTMNDDKCQVLLNLFNEYENISNLILHAFDL